MVSLPTYVAPYRKLPTLFGYKKHDFTKPRLPAYTMRTRPKEFDRSLGPGPAYNLRKNTRFGKDVTPCYTFGQRPKPEASFTPAPNTYHLGKKAAGPYYTMATRTRYRVLEKIPGPDRYHLPNGIGKKPVTKDAAPVFTMRKRIHDINDLAGPGPAGYKPVRSIPSLRTPYPGFSIIGRNDPIFLEGTPAPNSYYPKSKWGKCTYCVKGTTFGKRFSPLVMVLLLGSDVDPPRNRK